MALDCSAEALMADAKVLNGLGDGDIESVITYLLCVWASE